ncbi:MAG: hypothetical protein K0R50_4286, partial [Eubacterium sp.]|nr:hypothetical protein [Eubacterium sp.]
WRKYIKLVHDVVIPYQWEAINDRVEDAEPSHAIKNFRIAAGLEQGEFYGFVFQDTDLAKWLEAVAYKLETHPDAEIEKLADEAIELIEKAQQSDGYLNTYFTIKEPGKRWTNLNECHELYTAGHMIEAAVAYYRATGKRKFLEVMCRFADHIDSVFGTEPGKLKGYDGHQEVELALVKLYEATGNAKYLKLGKYFIDERGQKPNYFDIELSRSDYKKHFPGEVNNDRAYTQSHLPVREQDTAEGHSVRAVYMLTGMADVAALTQDKELLEACRRLWKNIVQKRMYITGGIGSVADGEAFSFDYDLPNDTMYTETCASIGLIFFAHRMLKAEPQSSYADVMERALYNNVLAGMSMDGRSFFYVNPLEVWPEASEKSINKRHVKAVRQRWFGCACCPPNVARLLSSLGQYIYTVNDSTLYTHLYIGGEAKADIAGTKVVLKQTTNYPWDGKVLLKLFPDEEKEFELAVRIPDWCDSYSLSLNGANIAADTADGYARAKHSWKQGDKVELNLDMDIKLMQANPLVRADAGKVAIQRGPLVYCLEELDNGSNLSAVSIPLDSSLVAEFDADLFGGTVIIKGNAFRTDSSDWGESLYKVAEAKEKPISIKAVPYCSWGNRNSGEMLVWIKQK